MTQQPDTPEQIINNLAPCKDINCDSEGTITAIGIDGEPYPQPCQYCFEVRIPAKASLDNYYTTEFVKRFEEDIETLFLEKIDYTEVMKAVNRVANSFGVQDGSKMETKKK